MEEMFQKSQRFCNLIDQQHYFSFILSCSEELLNHWKNEEVSVEEDEIRH